MRLTIASAEAGSFPIINCGSQIIPTTWGRVANLGEEQWDKTLLQKKNLLYQLMAKNHKLLLFRRDMKKFLQMMLVVLIASFSVLPEAEAQAQTRREGNTFIQSSRNSATNVIKTKYTWKDSKGTEYPIFITKNGRCFVNKISSKTGREYKYYLDEKTSRTIANEMGITYVPKQSRK